MGCPKNLTDTETMIGLLSDCAVIVQDPGQAEVIIVNTCGFIESAKQESIDTILEMAAYKETGLKKLVVTGCLAQRYSQEILKELPEVDALVGATSYPQIVQIIQQVMQDKQPVLIEDINKQIPENLPRVLATPTHYAYLKIAEGCDNNCTYCIIPKIRGRYRSRKIEDIVAEARDLAAKGCKELLLIAQDLTRYGMDNYRKLMLPDLLRELNEIEGICRIRLHYCYPEMVTDELIDAMTDCTKVCHYIDIPMQHISDRILRRMGRVTSRKNIETLVHKLRDKMPDIVIRSTFITGFPGETEDDFAMLEAFLTEAKLDKVGVFAFSEEEGTPAARMGDKIDPDVAVDRKNQLMEIQRGISLAKSREKIGKTLVVLSDGNGSGRSDGDSPEVDGKVFFAGKSTPGDMVRVKITRAMEYDLEGTIINE